MEIKVDEREVPKWPVYFSWFFHMTRKVTRKVVDGDCMYIIGTPNKKKQKKKKLRPVGFWSIY